MSDSWYRAPDPELLIALALPDDDPLRWHLRAAAYVGARRDEYERARSKWQCRDWVPLLATRSWWLSMPRDPGLCLVETGQIWS